MGMSFPAFFDLARLAGATWFASGRTIAQRSHMLASAMGDPAALDHPEFSRMGREKLDAAMEAGAAMALQLSGLQYRWATWWLQEGFRAAGAMLGSAASGAPI